MTELLGKRVAAHLHAGMSPDPERRHKEVMKALQIADFGVWRTMERARKEAPGFWEAEMIRLELEIEEANKDYVPEGDFPECSSNLARENLEKGRWRLQRPPAEVYTVLGVRADSASALVIDAIYTNTRRQKYFDEPISFFASNWGISQVTVWRIIGYLDKEGVLVRVTRPGKSSLFALNLEEIHRRINVYEDGGIEALIADQKERKKDLEVRHPQQNF